MAKKVAIYVDENVWNRFKEEVLRKYGTTRMLSKEVQNLVESYLASYTVMDSLQKFGFGTFISAEEVKKGRPKPRPQVSAGETLREMRDKRADLIQYI